MSTMPTHVSRFESMKGLSHGSSLESSLADAHRNTPHSIKSGRNITAGYVRGAGIHLGTLMDSVTEDPLFQESFTLSQGRSLMAKPYFINLFLIMKYGMKDLSGDMIEFGSYRGGGALFMANVARRLGFTGTVYALDTFEGMPPTDATFDFHQAGDFKDAFLNDLTAFKYALGLSNLTLVKGLFEETFPSLLQKNQHFSLVHIDCDTYAGVKYAIAAVHPHMHPAGGYLAFNDPLHGTCIGALEAVEEMVQEQGLRAEQAYPHLVYRIPKIAIPAL